MKKYLLDTCVCVFLFRDKYGVKDKLNEIGPENCFISDVTLAELVYGAFKSDNREENLEIIEEFRRKVQVVPFSETIFVYGLEKNRLRESGNLIEDFDLLIASSAITRGYTLVTDNLKHFQRFPNLDCENWINR